MLNEYGFDTMFSLSNQKAYLDISKRPWVIIDAVKTEFGDVKMIILISKYENSDNTSGYLGEIMFSYNSTLKSLINSDLDLSRYPVGGFFSKTSQRGNGCQALINQLAGRTVQSEEFCNFYFSNPQIFLNDGIFTEWKETGNLNIKNIIPFTLRSTKKIR